MKNEMKLHTIHSGPCINKPYDFIVFIILYIACISNPFALKY